MSVAKKQCSFLRGYQRAKRCESTPCECAVDTGENVNPGMTECNELYYEGQPCQSSGDTLCDPGLLAYYIDLDNRILHIKDVLDSECLERGSSDYAHEIGLILRWNIEDELNKIPPEERNPIKILIDCRGGDTDVMWHLIDVIDASVTPVYTINMQKAFSAAGILLMCGHKGKRYCMKHSAALIHDGTRGASGNNSYDFDSYVEFVKNIDKQTDSIIKERTNITDKILAKWRGREQFIYAEDQLTLGLVDHVLNNFGEIPWGAPYIEEDGHDKPVTIKTDVFVNPLPQPCCEEVKCDDKVAQLNSADSEN